MVTGTVRRAHQVFNKVVADIACHTLWEVEPVEVNFELLVVTFCRDVVLFVAFSFVAHGGMIVEVFVGL